jgi:hypothetical protein
MADALASLGRLLAISWSDSANALAAHELAGVFGREQVFQISATLEPGVDERVPHHLRGRAPFEKGLTLADMMLQLRAGARVRKTQLTEAFGLERLRAVYGDAAIPLFVLRAGKVRLIGAEEELVVEPGDVVLHLSPEPVPEPAAPPAVEPSPAGPPEGEPSPAPPAVEPSPAPTAPPRATG